MYREAIDKKTACPDCGHHVGLVVDGKWECDHCGAYGVREKSRQIEIDRMRDQVNIANDNLAAARGALLGALAHANAIESMVLHDIMDKLSKATNKAGQFKISLDIDE